MPRPLKHRSGYVLLMVLASTALVGLLLLGIAQRSLELARQAQESAGALQSRWGNLSLQHVVLDRAERHLAEARRQQDFLASRQGTSLTPRRVGRISGRITLGETTFRWILADEQAKLNLNTLVASRGNAFARGLLRQHFSADLAGSLSPVWNSGPKSDTITPLQSWGQIVDFSRLGQANSIYERLLTEGDMFTCWSPGGQVSYHNASDEVLQEVVRLGTNSSIAIEIVQLREDYPDKPLEEVLDLADTRDEQRSRLLTLLTEYSSSHSLWILSAQHTQQRERLVVRERYGAAVRLHTFER